MLDRFLHSQVHYALFTIIQTLIQPKYLSVDEWIKKRYVVEYYSSLIKKKILSFATTWMNLEGIMLSEIKQSLRGIYFQVSLTYGI